MKRIKLENRSRGKLYLTATRPHPVKGRAPLHDRPSDLVLGDAQDTDEYLAQHQTTRNKRCPSPVIEVTDAQLALLSPPSRAALEAWKRDGVIVMTELA